MKTITDKQAEHFRKSRQELSEAISVLDDAEATILDSCDHEDRVMGCCSCRLFVRLNRIKQRLRDTADELDVALERGPMPK